MKKLLILSIVFSFFAIVLKAQNGDNGKTYYDADKTRPKEVFSFKEVANNVPGAKGTTVHLKHGPYFFYFENGKIKISGQYKDDKKQGEWKYYDEQGNLKKTEKYESDKLMN